MSKTANPYGLSLFEYKGSNFSGTQATYPINPTIPVVPTLATQDLVGIAGGTNQLNNPSVGLCAGDIVTFTASQTSAGYTGGIPNGAWQLAGSSTGSLQAANSLYYLLSGQTSYNAPRPILGVFGGIQYLNATNQSTRSTYWPNGVNTSIVAANTTPVATINDLADCIFQVQCGGLLPNGSTVAGAMANIGKLCGFANNGSGNPSTGQSQLYLDVTTFYGGIVVPYANNALPQQFAPFRLIGLAPIQGNSWTDPYPDVLVMINNHMWKPGQPA